MARLARNFWFAGRIGNRIEEMRAKATSQLLILLLFVDSLELAYRSLSVTAGDHVELIRTVRAVSATARNS